MHRLCSPALAFSLCLASAFGQSNPAALDLTHPDAKALAGIDLRSLRESSVAQIFGSDIKSTQAGMMQFPGMGIFDDVEQVLVSSPGPVPGAKKENPPFLLIVTGHFAPDHVRPLLRGARETYNEVDIYTLGDNMGLAVFDEQTLVLGDVASLKGAVDRRGARKPSALASRGAAMASSYNVWVIATISPSAFQPGQMDIGKFAQDIRGIDAGMSVRDGLDLDIGVLASTAKAADDIGKLLSMGLQAGLASKMDPKGAMEIARKMQISSDGTRMHIKFTLNKEELENQMRTLQQARMTSNPRIAPAPVSVVPDRSPKTIKIFGLDDGVHEIPFSQR